MNLRTLSSSGQRSGVMLKPRAWIISAYVIHVILIKFDLNFDVQSLDRLDLVLHTISSTAIAL